MIVPLYRLQGHGDHFYTTSADERDAAIAQFGYTSEGVACFVMSSADEDTTQLRDRFALAALNAILRCSLMNGAMWEPGPAARRAWEYADAMVNSR